MSIFAKGGNCLDLRNLGKEFEVFEKKITLLENPLIIDYFSKLSGNSNGETPVGDIVKAIQSNPLITDLAIERSLNGKITLSKIRHHLIELYQKRILLYKREINEDTGWIFYKWYFNPNGLKRSYISSMNEKIGELESRVMETQNGMYFCERDGTHPALGFDDATDEGRYRCEKCGSPLIYRTGEELAKPINKEIETVIAGIKEAESIGI